VFLKMDKQTGLTSARRPHSVAFTGCAIQAVNAACLGALAILVGACASTQPIAFNDALRQELIQMRDADQRIRTTALNATNFHGILAVDGPAPAAHEGDRRPTRLAGKIARGEDGSHAAWLLVQHATQDPGFMDHCRGLMEDAVEQGEASPKDYAFLVDRVRLQRGKMQLLWHAVYQGFPGPFDPPAAQRPGEVDERRHKMGMEPLADYEAELRRFLQREVKVGRAVPARRKIRLLHGDASSRRAGTARPHPDYCSSTIW
jgi:hypothetical protein